MISSLQLIESSSKILTCIGHLGSLLTTQMTELQHRDLHYEHSRFQSSKIPSLEITA